MKVLTIHQPWAWLIARGIKDVENRRWPINYRGLLLVHAGIGSSSVPIEVTDLVRHMRGDEPLPIGGVIGLVEIIDCVRSHPSKWFHGPFGFVLRNARELSFTACRGHQGLFDPPAALAELVTAIRTHTI